MSVVQRREAFREGHATARDLRAGEGRELGNRRLGRRRHRRGEARSLRREGLLSNAKLYLSNVPQRFHKFPPGVLLQPVREAQVVQPGRRRLGGAALRGLRVARHPRPVRRPRRLH